MRTDLPWLDIARSARKVVAPRPPKPPRLIELEVRPGRILLSLGARRRLAIVAAVLGMGATLGPLTSAAQYPGGSPPWALVLPPGRRLDPAL
jgi:hypothetical protein